MLILCVTVLKGGVTPKTRGVRLVTLSTHADRRGKLSFAQWNDHLSWLPKRFFCVHDVPAGEHRGHHGHETCAEFLCCVVGSVRVHVDDGESRESFMLDSPSVGIEIGPHVWISQEYVEPGSVLIVLASEEHKPQLYIHDYARIKFLAQSRASQAMKVPFLNVRESSMVIEKKVRDAFERVLLSGCYIGGSEVETFENNFAHFCGAHYCVGVGSGLAAIHLLLVALSIGPGDEVIIPSNTFIATALGVRMAGATPVFVEPDATFYNLDAALVEEKITARTRAVLAVDLYGQPFDVDALATITQRHPRIFLLSDAAQSHGALYKGRRTGSLVHASCFSFYPGKNLGALGDAGAVTTDDGELARKLRGLRNYGSSVKYVHDVEGFNERMDPMQAAFLSAKLPELEKWNTRRDAIAQRYTSALASLDWLQTPSVQSWAQPSWHLYVVRCAARDALREHLLAHNVECLIHYPVPMHLQAAFSGLGFASGSFPIAEELARSVLSLPICPFMTDKAVEYVIAAVNSFKP